MFEKFAGVEGSFFGVNEERGTTLQFMWRKNGKLDVDVPVNKKNGSYTKIASFAECRALLAALRSEIQPDELADQKFRGW
jgi:hypothetical protein